MCCPVAPPGRSLLSSDEPREGVLSSDEPREGVLSSGAPGRGMLSNGAAKEGCVVQWQGRGNRGGGQWGQLAPTTLDVWGRRPPPPLWTVNVVHFCFCLIFTREIGSLPKNSGPKPGIFSYG